LPFLAGAAIAVALSAVPVATTPQAAVAQGLFDFLFGGFHRRQEPPPRAQPYADPYATPPRDTPGAPVRPRYGSGGRSAAYCVRLCDGQHFPLQRTANATQVEMCRAMCPASNTKIFFGNPIDHAVASDGTRYASLDNAFVYRDRLVPGCTCNGKNAFGLVPLDINKDPTLRPGDLVATSTGLMAYSGRPGRETAAFTPVDPSLTAADAARQSSKRRFSRRGTGNMATSDRGDDAGRPELRGQFTR
jgi:hypothetical protein